MKKSLFFLAIMLCGLKCSATHLSGGEIYVERVSPTSLSFRITIRVFTNIINTNVLFGGEDDWLDFGDGQRMLVPETPNIIRPDLGDGVAIASFSIIHTYASPSTYRISYSEPNWENGIINFDESVSTRFYLEAIINALPGYQASPKFLREPFITALLREPLSMAMTATDTSDYRLRYALVAPKRSTDLAVSNYRLPENASVHPTNGLFQWDTKFNGDYLSGPFLFCVKVSQYDAENRLVGSVIRNFLIRLEDDDWPLSFSLPSQLDANNAIEIPQGNSGTLRVRAFGDRYSTQFQLRSELTHIPGALQFTQYDTTVNDVQMQGGRLVLNSLSEINRDNPYALVVRVRFFNDSSSGFRDFAMLFYTRDIAPEEPEEPITSVGEKPLRGIFVYPNPVSTFLHFNEEVINEGAHIIDMSGKIILSKEKNSSVLDVSTLPPGVYLVILEKRNRAAQIIIKR